MVSWQSLLFRIFSLFFYDFSLIDISTYEKMCVRISSVKNIFHECKCTCMCIICSLYNIKRKYSIRTWLPINITSESHTESNKYIKSIKYRLYIQAQIGLLHSILIILNRIVFNVAHMLLTTTMAKV